MNIASENTDDFVKHVVKVASLEKPGDEFIPSLMSKIEDLNTADNKLTVASPIISWKGWGTIGLIITIIFTILLLSDSKTLSFPVYSLSFDFITSLYSSISISRVFLMGLSAFVFYFIINISITTKRVLNMS